MEKLTALVNEKESAIEKESQLRADAEKQLRATQEEAEKVQRELGTQKTIVAKLTAELQHVVRHSNHIGDNTLRSGLFKESEQTSKGVEVESTTTELRSNSTIVFERVWAYFPF